jgi:hypothetical protein
LLKNIFSTILNLASLQIQNSLFELKQLNLLPLRFDKNCYRKNLNSHSEPYLHVSQEFHNKVGGAQ